MFSFSSLKYLRKPDALQGKSQRQDGLQSHYLKVAQVQRRAIFWKKIKGNSGYYIQHEGIFNHMKIHVCVFLHNFHVL